MTKRANKARVQRRAFEITRSSVASQVLTALWWWTPYARVSRDGLTWVVKTDVDFIEQDGVLASSRSIREAVALLRNLGLIQTTRGPHPSKRAPNARYLRLADGVCEQLESGKTGADFDPVNVEDLAPSTRPGKPHQTGESRRFHIQKDSRRTSKKTAKKKEQSRAVQISQSQADSDEIPEALLRVQTAFDEGCKKRVYQKCAAPALDYPKRRDALQRFYNVCVDQGLSVEESAAVARHFGENYDADLFAKAIGRPVERVSGQPDHFVLAIAASSAIDAWRRKDDNKWGGKTGFL